MYHRGALEGPCCGCALLVTNLMSHMNTWLLAKILTGDVEVIKAQAPWFLGVKETVVLWLDM